MIGPLRPVAAFAACAAHAQYLKNLLDKHRELSEIRQFSVEQLASVIFDAAMFGGLLRTFDPRHVHDPTRAEDLAACLVERDWGPGMLAELAIAAAEYKLPASCVLACLTENEQQLAAEGSIELLRALTGQA